MMVKWVALVAAGLGLSGCCLGYGACPGSAIHIDVVDATNGTAPMNAESSDPRFVCRTNGGGTICSPTANLPAGTYTVTISAPGFSPATVTVTAVSVDQGCGCVIVEGSATARLAPSGMPAGDAGSGDAGIEAG